LGRSLSIREVDAGSCNGCELEIHALNNAFYDLERFGLHFVASPRHADVLLVTGPVTRNMREALERTYNATPDPKWVVAVGDCAVDGGIFSGSYAVVGGVSGVVPVDLHIRGCPPQPTQLLKGLLTLLEPSIPQVIPRRGHPFKRYRDGSSLRSISARAGENGLQIFTLPQVAAACGRGLTRARNRPYWPLLTPCGPF
jgi:Ni,Fe-hydrogenase III small subunit